MLGSANVVVATVWRSMTRNRSRLLAYQRLKLIPLAVAACFGSIPAFANPTGAQVVNGAESPARPRL